MNCGTCSAEVTPGSRFCASCGAPLKRFCHECGAAVSPDASFCGKCGFAMGGKPAAAKPERPDKRAVAAESEGERRQLTVLFADVVGATSLSGQIDPEALRTLLREYQAVCVESVVRYGGTIHQYAGDGVLAYFGYPTAHDNDPERAILAGLAIVASIRRLTDERRARGEVGFSARIGVHTGLVVMGEMGTAEAREIHAIGETPNVAARIQSEAVPDSVCISAATLRLAGRRFQVRALGPRPLKGVAKELELFSVDAAVQPDAGSPLVSAHAPLVGRDGELQHLLERWGLAKRGRGQAVLVSGEGGIGKSRLLAAFRERADARAGAWRNIFCSPFYQNSALKPMIDLIERAMERATGEAEGVERTGALRRIMEDSALADEMTFTLVASLLGLGDEHDRALRELEPDQRKRRTLDALVAWLHADSLRHPLVVVIEDLHWIDASTRDLLGILLERIADFPILAILTFRPEFVPTWTLHGQISMIALARLEPDQVEAITLGATGGKALPPRVLEEVIRRTDGIPLFVEELTKAILSAGLVEERDGSLQVVGGPAAKLEIPETLRDSLTARLDRLGPAKGVAQLASVLGREFDYAELQAVCDLPAAEIEARLAELNRAEIIHQRGVPPRSHYVFKHALIQEAAYDTLLMSTRRLHHRRIAEAYEQRFPDIANSRPELIAHHYTYALMAGPALTYWQRAGELAVSRSGYSEALGHLGAALEQLELLPDTPERSATELALRVKIGPALAALKGFSSVENGDNYERACRLAAVLGDRPERFMAMWGDWLYKTTSGRVEDASLRAGELVILSRRLGKDDYVLQAHHARWTNFFVIGDVGVSRADTLEGIRLYDRERHRDHKHLYGGHDPGVCALGVGANAAWLSGYTAESLRLADLVLATGRDLGHPFSEALAFTWASCVFQCAGRYTQAKVSSEKLVAICEKHSFRQWAGIGIIVAGESEVQTGSAAFGLKLVEEGLAVQRTAGPKSHFPFLGTVAATAHLRAGNHSRALDLLSESIDFAKRLKFGWFLPEAERLFAEASLQAGTISAADAMRRIEAAAQLAGQQSAALLQWRANLSLARLLGEAGRTAEARARLNAIRNAAGDGMDALELLEAKRLLTAA